MHLLAPAAKQHEPLNNKRNKQDVERVESVGSR
jgi:hypothetical protein